jgi:hypothetical protein
MTGPDESATDARLAALLAPPERAGDRAFLARVERAVDVEAALVAAEGRFWKSFGLEALAIGALLAALWLLSGTALLAPFAGPGQWGLAPPLLLIVALWFAGTQKLRQS